MDQIEQLYRDANHLRRLAYTLGDPELFELAAAEFEAIGFVAAAEACRVRGKHYRELQSLQDVEELSYDLV